MFVFAQTKRLRTWLQKHQEERLTDGDLISFKKSLPHLTAIMQALFRSIFFPKSTVAVKKILFVSFCFCSASA
jgi:hypothetical protein